MIYGNGEMACLARFYLSHDSEHEVVAFTVERSYLDSDTFDGLPLVALDEAVERYPAAGYRAFVAMGYGRVNRDRAERFTELRELGYDLDSYVSWRSFVWPDLQIGQNCFVMEGITIQPSVVIGDDVTLGPGNTIGHHCVLGDHSFLASHVDLSGHVDIGRRTFVGANATVRNRVSLASDNVIGAGAVIMADTDERGVYAAPRAKLLTLPSDKLPRI